MGERLRIEEKRFKELKRLGYSECKVYQYKYKFGKLNIDGKRLLEYFTYDKEKNRVIHEDFCSKCSRKSIVEFNECDFVKKEISYDELGEIYHKTIFEYNDKGLLIKESKYGNQNDPQDDLQGHPISIITYRYGDTGLRLLKENCAYTRQGKLRWKGVDKYNNKGLRIEYSSFTTENMLAYKNGYKKVYEYNDKDLLIKFTEYNSCGELTIKHTFEYYDNGRWEERSVYDNGWVMKNIYKYNDKGKIIESMTQGKDDKGEYRYNDKGSIIEVTYFSGENKIGYGYEYQYNDKDLLIKETRYGSMKEPLETTAYEYV